MYKYYYPETTIWASLVAQTLKNLPVNTGDRGLVARSGRSPGEGNGYPLQYSGLENCMSLAGYSPWGHKGLDTAE